MGPLNSKRAAIGIMREEVALEMEGAVGLETVIKGMEGMGVTAMQIDKAIKVSRIAMKANIT